MDVYFNPYKSYKNVLLSSGTNLSKSLANLNQSLDRKYQSNKTIQNPISQSAKEERIGHS